MNHLSSQGVNNGSWGYEEEQFAMPAPKKLPGQMNWKCPHCGTANSNVEAVEYHWPDRSNGMKKGYVACCKNCGCRKLLMAAVQSDPGPGGSLPPPPPPKPPVLKILLGTAVAITAVVLVVIIAGKGRAATRPNPQPIEDPSSSAVISNDIGSQKGGGENPEPEHEPEPTPMPEPIAYEDSPTEHMGIKGIGPVDVETLNSLPESITTSEWDNKGQTVQGMDWNSDNNQTAYFSISSYIAACDLNGNRKSDEPTNARFYSLDYYNGIVFDVWRSEDYGRFRLEMRNPNTMKRINYNLLDDIHDAYKQEKKIYGDKLRACIDGITVAPRIGAQDKPMIYVSYNTYILDKESEDRTALNYEQVLYEYDYEKVLSTSKGKLTAERTLSLDIGIVDYGIQTLELDRSTGNIWCAVRPGQSEYSLYCIDGKSKGTELSLVPNGDRMGWDCDRASDGFCSLGHDQFFILVPSKNNDWVTLEARRIDKDELEDYN